MKHNENILALHLSHHGTMTYVKNKKIIFHTQLDRYNRIKNSSLPSYTLEKILENLEIDILIITNLKYTSLEEWKYIFKNCYHWKNKFKNLKVINHSYSIHHLFHVYCSLLWNKFEKGVVFVHDGGGAVFKNNVEEKETAFNINKNKINQIFLDENPYGYYYRVKADNIFNSDHQEGKLMALSNYGKYDERFNKDCIIKNKDEILETNTEVKNFAFTSQKILENSFFDVFKKHNIQNKNLIFTGGVTQNVLLNSKIQKQISNTAFFDPLNSDNGISLGAINYYLNNKLEKIDDVYLGIKQDLDLSIFNNYKIKKVNSDDVAKIVYNEPVSIFQSRSEQGQRGLGNRSLLMNPFNEFCQDKINEIKKREWYRPFATSILEEDFDKWFETNGVKNSPYMMSVFKIKNVYMSKLYSGFSIYNESRVQTVNKKNNLNFYKLLKSFKKIYKLPMLLNTSLNMPGEVLVETLYDLKEMFKKTKLKFIYIPEINKLIMKD
jgi:carbamoyltransferase